MPNDSFGRRFKNARKNAQREIDIRDNIISTGRISNIKSNRWVCMKHSYPLGVLCFSLSDFDKVIRRRSKNLKWKTLNKLAKKARSKGKIIYAPCYGAYWPDEDFRNLPFKNYKISRWF